jgi:Lrp/AsnC family transcriptional regulator, leucine-responsive regulatory protein
MEDSSNCILDTVDQRILRLPQADGRLTNAELAVKVNVSPATCHRRTQRLFEDGFILSVRSVIAPSKVGLGAVALVGVVLDRSTPESFAQFEAAIMDMPVVPDCHLVAGSMIIFSRFECATWPASTNSTGKDS